MIVRHRPEEAEMRAREIARTPLPAREPDHHTPDPPGPGRRDQPKVRSRSPARPANPPADRTRSSDETAPLHECAKAFFDRRASRHDLDPALDEEWGRVYRSLGPILEAATRVGRCGLLEPDDAIQEAWLALIVRFRMYQAAEGGPEFAIWLAAVVRNRLANLERRAARRPHASLGRDEAGALMGREEDPADAYERELVRAAVRGALAESRGRVPEASYLVVVLRWIEGHTTPEIAEALGMTTSQVRDRHRRAFPVLRHLLSRRFRADRAGLAAAGRDLGPLDPGAGGMMP